jgi:hypothetical protein
MQEIYDSGNLAILCNVKINEHEGKGNNRNIRDLQTNIN